MSKPSKPKLGCDFTGQDFGAPYPDSCCIDGYLWDLDSAESSGSDMLTSGGEIPCPKCNRRARVALVADEIWASSENITKRNAKLEAARKVDKYVNYMQEKWA